MSKRIQQKEATRQNLLTEAKQLFIDQGYDETTTRQLAQACGVSIGTVFSHFSDKPALLKAILQQDIERALEEGRAELTSETSAFPAYLAFARRLYRFYAEHRSLSQTLLAYSLFEYGEFEQQMDAYIGELAERLIRVDHCPEDKANTLAYNLMANYFLVLVSGLSRPQESETAWLKQLEELCSPLEGWVRLQRA